MRVKERLTAIKLINRAKNNQNYFNEIGVTAEMKKVEPKGKEPTQKRL